MMDDEKCLRARGLLATAELDFREATVDFGDGTEREAAEKLVDALFCVLECLDMVRDSNGIPYGLLVARAPLTTPAMRLLVAFAAGPSGQMFKP